MFDENNIVCKFVQTDEISEFKTAFKRVLNTRGITHYYSFSDLKASIVERFNRTLKNWM